MVCIQIIRVLLLCTYCIQVTHEAHYRERKYVDHYQGLNFGLLEFQTVSVGNKGTKSDSSDHLDTATAQAGFSRQLVMKILNHEGNTVITKTLPLTSHRSNRAEKMATTQAAPITAAAAADTRAKQEPAYSTGVCEPYWGPVPVWRHWLTRFAMASIPFTLLIVPGLVVVWFLFLFCFYISYDAETQRRERIEENYQKMKMN